MSKTLNVSIECIKETLHDILVERGFSEDESSLTADIFATNAADGILSHSIIRFPRLVDYIEKGIIRPSVVPKLFASYGAFEKYDAGFGLGTSSAYFCSNRVCELVDKYGVGVVSLRNANHWMRGGYYGLMIADKGNIGICWTNTMPNMPAWGAVERNIGNNPLIVSVPSPVDGKHLMVDTSMSQFSYGKIEEARIEGVPLCVPGGYDSRGNLTTDAAEIEKTWRVLPAGYWKGSSLSILLDAVAAMSAEGNNVSSIGRGISEETGLSQVFIAIKVDNEKNEFNSKLIAEIKASINSALPANGKGYVRYPGEIAVSLRKSAETNGINVPETVWNKIIELKKEK